METVGMPRVQTLKGSQTVWLFPQEKQGPNFCLEKQWYLWFKALSCPQHASYLDAKPRPSRGAEGRGWAGVEGLTPFRDSVLQSLPSAARPGRG